MRTILLTAGLAQLSSGQSAGQPTSCGEPCALAPNNLWAPEDLPAYFLCLQSCCRDYDPNRLLDGLTCDDIVGFAADQGGCDADLGDFGLNHISKGTLIKHVCPAHCHVCEEPTGTGETCDATLPDDDLNGYLRCLGSSCMDFDTTVFPGAGRCADLLEHGCDTPLVDLPEMLTQHDACSANHRYIDLGTGACRSPHGNFDRGFYRNAVGGGILQTSPDQCKTVCDAEPSCTGYMVGQHREAGYCKVMTKANNAPSGWSLHASDFSNVGTTNHRPAFHCYGVGPSDQGACVPVDATVGWACPASCKICTPDPDAAVPVPCSAAADCHGHGSTTDEDASDGCVCTCNAGWSGDSCVVPPPCTTADCSEHGTTTDTDRTNGCNCVCTDGFSGLSCAVPPPCVAAVDCSGHGTTTDKDRTTGTPLCDCECTDDYTGDDCSVPPPCTPDDCSGHGTTTDSDRTDGCTCECSEGPTGGWYTGHNCGIPPPCTPADCSGHGAVYEDGTMPDQDRTDGCTCSPCKDSYSGDRCETPPACVAVLADPDAPAPVFLSADDSGETYSYAMYGTFADAADDDRNMGDCGGHGTTTDMDATDGCICDCVDGWSGDDCSEPPVPCSELGSGTREYELVGDGWCRSAAGNKVAGYMSQGQTADACKHACDLDQQCIGYGTQDWHGHDCRVHGDETNPPAGFWDFSEEEEVGGSAHDIGGVKPNDHVQCFKTNKETNFMRVKGFPSVRKGCNGLYQKVPDETPNGAKSFKSLSQDRLLLRREDGSWAIMNNAQDHRFAHSADTDSHDLPSNVPEWNIGDQTIRTVSVNIEQLCNGHGSTEDLNSADGCQCTCTDGFTGNNCGVPPPCVAAVDCHGHGTTRDLDKSDGCICRCRHGWTGAQCRIPPPCNPHRDCNAHGLTTDLDMTDGCECNCLGGWTGANCGVPPPCVAATDCNGHGSTTDPDNTDGCQCVCTDGWTGPDTGCAVPPPCVAAVDCSGHGTTTDKDKTDGCVCVCSAEFTGDDCATPPPCTDRDCNNHGTTTDLDKTDGCVCDECFNDYSGANCGVPPIPCSALGNCNGHGETTDIDSVDGCDCVCTDEYTGKNCGIPPPCRPATDCSGHGATTDLDRTTGTPLCDCDCADGYTGDDCSVPPPCDRDDASDVSADCSLHGTTTDADRTNGCACDCTDGFTGDDCAIPPPCNALVDCSGHGSTTDKDRTDDCDCVCQGGYTGDDCQTPPPCSAIADCSGHGTTKDLDKTDGCVCNCKDGWSGDDCHQPPPCVAAVDCSGHGTTTDLDKTDGCNCTCTQTPQWTGDDCSIPPIPCQADTNCNGHGTTDDNDASNGCDCTCNCTHSYGCYTGKNCGIPPPCKALKDCNGHGTTTDMDKTDGCECQCTAHWTGHGCQVPPPCNADAADGCHGHGSTTDLDKTDGCDCTCDDDWTGDNCGVYNCRELHVPGGCHGLDGKEFSMYVNGYDGGSLNKWLSFNWADHWTLARYDLKTDSMPLLFQKADECNQYKLQNKWTGEEADNAWLGYSPCGEWIQATSGEDDAATFELVPICDETLSGPVNHNYRGCQSETRSGRTCQKWTAQTPHAHTRTEDNYPHKGLGDHNQCRNPDDELTIWCYTTDADRRWEFCDPLPQSEFKMREVSKGYLSYTDKDRDEHPQGSIQADFTLASGMVFNLHRDCPAAPPAAEDLTQVTVHIGHSVGHNEKCVDTTTTVAGVQCADDAGNRGIRTNTDFATADDAFIIHVTDDHRVCANRQTDTENLGWGMDLQISCMAWTAPSADAPPANLGLAAESPALQILRENPLTISCFAGALALAAASSVRRSRRKTGDLYVALAEQDGA